MTDERTLAAEALRRLEDLHDEFARQASGALTTTWGQVVDVDCAKVAQMPYREFTDSLALPCIAYRYQMGSPAAWGVFDFSHAVVFPFVDRGLDAGPATPTMEDRMARVEAGSFSPVVKEIIIALETAWAPATPVVITDIELVTEPVRLEVASPDDTVVVLRYEVNATHFTGMISICYPPSIGQRL